MMVSKLKIIMQTKFISEKPSSCCLPLKILACEVKITKIVNKLSMIALALKLLLSLSKKFKIFL